MTCRDHAELAARDLDKLGELKDRSWDGQEFTVTAIDGHRLLFCDPASASASPPPAPWRLKRRRPAADKALAALPGARLNL